ncbi:MAG: T9SS type A sorting domain-containing protein [Bacteroidota bacterium]
MKLKKLLTTSLLTSILLTSYSQTVTTFAGKSYFGNGSYNGVRSNHKDSTYFSAPYGIDIDTAGRIYISNEQNIMLIIGNTCKLVAGYNLDPMQPGAADSKDGTGVSARFSNPAGVCINRTTNELFVADVDNHQIRKVSTYVNNFTDPSVSTHAGLKLLNGGYLNSTNSASKFNAPVGVAVASNGDVYVADRNNHCIRKISGGNVTTIAGKNGVQGHDNGSGTVATFDAPFSVYLDGNTLYVADYGNSAIRKIDLSNNAVTDFITSGLSSPTDLCKFEGAWYITERTCIKRYESSVLSLYAGSTSQSGDVDGIGKNARFEEISSITFNTKQNLLYIVDKGNNVIKTITPNSSPICNFTVSNAAPTKGQTIILKNASANKPVNFRWTITPANYTLLNNSKITDSLIYINFSQVGSYTAKLWVSNNGGADSLTKNNCIIVSSVTAKPSVEFSASKTNPVTNEVISLIDQSANDPSTWTWRITPATYIYVNGTDSNSRIPNVKFTNGDNYTITLIAENAQGISTLTKNNYIQVNAQSSVKKSLIANSITIYPNPAQSHVTIKHALSGELTIYNTQGQIVGTYQKNETEVMLDLGKLTNGMYIIVLTTDEGKITARVSIQS